MKTLTVLCVLFPNFESIEMTVPVDLLRRCDVSVVTVALNDASEVKSSTGIIVKADKAFSSVKAEDFDVLLIPGGEGGFEVQKNEKLLAMIRQFHEQKKWIAAICMAPLILKNAGCLPEKFTAHDCVKKELNCTSTEAAVTDEKAKIITGRGPGAAFEFAFEMMKNFVGDAAVRGCKEGIHFR
jgi:4-methyl-5(b-hydroxyethyl)-thiazole monophosphate biosynthesis